MCEMLKILYANLNNYTSKKHIIGHYIEQNNINCALFVETKTNNQSNTSYKNWNILQQNGLTIMNTRGGSLAQIDPKLKMRKENAPRINNPLNEVTHFSIPFLEDRLHILLLYNHPNAAKIEDTVFTKATLYKYCLIIGDFNPGKNRTKNTQIQDFLSHTNFKKASTPPTFIMQNNPDSTPDLIFYTKNLENSITTIITTPDICSDHLAIQIDVNMKTLPPIEDDIKINLKKCNINKVNQELLELVLHNPQPNENSIKKFNNCISEAVTKHSPKFRKNCHIYQLPPFIIRLIKNKRKMYREYKLNQNPDFKTNLNMYSKNIQKLIFQYRESQWIQTCNNINSQQGKNYWQQIKKLSKYGTNVKQPQLEEGGKIYTEDQEKVELFAKHFEKSFEQDNDANFDQNHFEHINNWHNVYFQGQKDYNTEPYTIQEVQYLEILNKGKSTTPGFDNVTKAIIRKLDKKIHQYIIKIYEYCLNNCYIPQEWKHGIIITIPKPNTDSNKVRNYRPITLLSVLAKNFEKLIKEILNKSIGNKIPGYQFGFRQNVSTLHPLSILISNVQTAKLTGQRTAAIMLDINKAFDSVWHKGILYKLFLLKCPKSLIYLIKNYLTNRSLQIRINKAYSYTFQPEQGVPQGSPLSPFLYNVFCYDIYNTQIEHTFNKDLYILQFADDTALISHNHSILSAMQSLQNLMNRTSTWFKQWRLKANPTKSQLIIFNHNPSFQSPTISIDGQIIHAKPNVKYLGVTLDHKLNLNQHSKNIKKHCITRAKHFRSLTYKDKGISKKTAAHIYKTICRPLLEYMHPMYLNCRRPALKNIEVGETSSVRIITKVRHPNNPLHNPSNAFLYQLTSIQPITERLPMIAARFAKKPHTITIMQQFFKTRDPLQRPARKFPENTLNEIITNI